jgi:acyl-CoA reductase-like NAD-dependent aldehyde dehydrogenase
MSKKERVKGKGADIFFSEEQAEETEEAEEEQSEELVTKATFYFTQSQLDALEKAVFLLSQEHRIKTNKSEIMRIACEEMVNDFLENRLNSALLKRLK